MSDEDADSESDDWNLEQLFRAPTRAISVTPTI